MQGLQQLDDVVMIDGNAFGHTRGARRVDVVGDLVAGRRLQTCARIAMGAGVVICQNDSPRGFMGSVIICW